MPLYDDTTLMIRHFPPEASKDEKIDFFTHFGAVDIRCLNFKNKKNGLIIARFESSEVASNVLKKLHQTEVLGQKLSVEYIRNNDQIKNLATEKSSAEVVKEDVTSAKRKHFEQFLQKLNSWTNSINFNQPPPVHLKYQYPPPTHLTLTNIVKSLATVPKFYTQVLHLMNRMNLPCPFIQDYPIESSLVVVEKESKEGLISLESVEDQQDPGSSDESEMPSDDENEGSRLALMQSLLVPKRTIQSSKKQVKRPKFLKPQVLPPSQSKPPTAPKDVFEKEPHQLQSLRKIEVKLTQDLQSLQESQMQTLELAAEGFEKIEPSKTDETNQETEPMETVSEEVLDTEESVISAEELASNRISSRDRHILPVFKNYQPGIPSCRLYIKNLSKNVVDKDLHHIFRRYFLKNKKEEQGTMFDIRLMQEGRMKGQAFITLQTVAQAELALKETNGFILKDKPMVVQFARSSKTK